MKDPHLVIHSPVITEKSTFTSEKNNCYTFKVATASNKIDIARAIEEIFDVKVKKVNTAIQRGRRKRVGRTFGTTRPFKKAIVTLKPGYKIDLV